MSSTVQGSGCIEGWQCERMFFNFLVRFPKNLSTRHFQCFVLCALSAANASTKAPNTIESLASTVTQKYLKTEPQFATVIQNALFKCMNASSAKTSTTGLSTKIGPEPGSFICDPNALLIKGCIAIEIFLVRNDLQVTSDGSNDLIDQKNFRIVQALERTIRHHAEICVDI